MNVEMILQLPMAKEYPKLAANPKGFPELARKLIALEKEPMAWDVKAPVLEELAQAGVRDRPGDKHRRVVEAKSLL